MLFKDDQAHCVGLLSLQFLYDDAGSNREFGHPLFRTFNAHDYGDAYEIYAVTEDEEGRMLFGCQDDISVT
jgi:hypothetical protein